MTALWTCSNGAVQTRVGLELSEAQQHQNSFISSPDANALEKQPRRAIHLPFLLQCFVQKYAHFLVGSEMHITHLHHDMAPIYIATFAEV